MGQCSQIEPAYELFPSVYSETQVHQVAQQTDCLSLCKKLKLVVAGVLPLQQPRGLKPDPRNLRERLQLSNKHSMLAASARKILLYRYGFSLLLAYSRTLLLKIDCRYRSRCRSS